MKIKVIRKTYIEYYPEDAFNYDGSLNIYSIINFRQEYLQTDVLFEGDFEFDLNVGDSLIVDEDCNCSEK